jgi:hypothetical protein
VAVDDAINALGEHRADVVRRLAPADRARLAEMLRRLAEADQRDRLDVAGELILFLVRRLPEDHPVRRAFALDQRGMGAGTIDLAAFDEIAAQLADLDFSDEPGQAGPGAGHAGHAGLGADQADQAEQADHADHADHADYADHAEQAVLDLAEAIRADLLAAPSRSPAEVRAGGGDPDEAGVIRLPASEHDIRLPAFQFDADMRPRAVVVSVNRLLGAEHDPWGVASWWLDGNTWLGDVPADLVGRVSDDAIVAAARSDLEDD